jgi:exodeoxyribonuclease I
LSNTTNSDLVEQQLYDGFFPTEDEVLAQQFHNVPWEERPDIVDAFKDRRLRQIGQRLIYCERPDLMTNARRVQYDRAIAARIVRDDAEAPWLTLPNAIVDIDGLIANANPEVITFLQEYRAHLQERIARATETLSQNDM